MISDLNSICSVNSRRMKRSAIRECLKLTQRPDIISFAGGLPAPATFPYEDLAEIACEVIRTDGPAALQYSTTEGDTGLREELIKRYKSQNIDVSMDNIIITTASQQSLDLLGRIFIDPGDKVICGLPSYLGGIAAFKTYGAELVGIKFDDKGMRSDILEKTLEEMKEKGEKPKFIYIIPDFQNPAGVTMPEERRKEIVTIAQKYDVLIVEDSPYRELRFEGKTPKTIFEIDGTGQVIMLGTFSKIFVPGFRVGWIVAHPDIIDKFVVAKQSSDLCTSSFVQKITALYMKKGLFEKNLTKIADLYKRKKDVMMDAFEKYMPEGVTWTNPEGGLFLFLYLPEHMDSEKLFMKAVENKVAFVVGTVFHCDGSGKNTMRLNFSYVSEEELIEGVKRLSNVIRAEM